MTLTTPRDLCRREEAIDSERQGEMEEWSEERTDLTSCYAHAQIMS